MLLAMESPMVLTGVPVSTKEEYLAARLADRFFLAVKGQAVGLDYLAEAHCFTAVVEAVDELARLVNEEVERRAASRQKQLQLEGLAPAQAINEASFPVGLGS